MNFSDYRLEQNGLVICEPCLCVSMFSALDLSAPGAPDTLGPYRAFLALFQDQFSYCRLDGDQMHPKPITAELLQKPVSEMQDDKRRKKGGVIAEIRSGQSPDENRAPSLSFVYSKIGKPHTALRANFPLPWFEAEGLVGVRRYLEQSLSDFPLQAGYVGYAFSWETEAEQELQPNFLRWLQRHPGLMEPGFAHRIISYYGLPDLGWITLLGQAYVQQMGGEAALMRATAHVPEIAYEPLPEGGLGIRIGDFPRLGDALAGDHLEDYRALGRVLAPLHPSDILIENMVVEGIDDDADHARWIKRFFPD